MNERIRELAEQAELNATLLFNKEKLEKFAELIVRECAQECSQHFVGAVGTYPGAHNSAVKKCLDSIKARFGVEE